jgi:hypothetical protein
MTMRRMIRLAIASVLYLAVLPTPAVQAAEEPAAAAKSSRIQGTAIEGLKQGVAGVLVRVRPEDAEQPIWLTATDRNGRFKIEALPDGDYRVDLYRAGYLPVSKERVSIRFPFRAVVEQPMQAGSERLAGELPASWKAAASPSEGSAALSGSISTRDGGALAEVRVRILHLAGDQDPRDLRTDDRGRFVAAELGTGDWMLEVRGLGYLPMRTPLRINEGDNTAILVLTPQPPEYQPTARDLLPLEQPSLPRLMLPDAVDGKQDVP